MFVAIVEDDQNDQEKIKCILNGIDPSIQTDAYFDAESFLKNDSKYDLVILDIDLPEMDGIRLSKLVRNRVKGIVFLTAYEDKVFDAFGYNILAYLLKTMKEQVITDKIKSIIDEIKDAKTIELQLLNERTLSLTSDGVYQITIENRRLFVYTCSKTFRMKHMNISQVYQLFEGKLLYANQSSLINPLHVSNIKRDGTILLDNGLTNHLSRYKKKQFMQELMERVGNL